MSAPQQHIGLVTTPYGEAHIYIGRYPSGGAIAVQLIASGELPEPLATFSTNLGPHGALIDDDEFCVKAWSENEPFVAPMLATGLFEDTGKLVPTGFVFVPVWRVKNPMHVPPTRKRATTSAGAFR